MGDFMSSLIPSGSASGTGSMTLAAPVTNSNQTVTLPDATGTVMVSGNMPAFSAYLSSAQTLSGSTWTKITCQTKEFDTASCYDNTTNYRFTPTVAGYYMVTGRTQIASTATDGSISIYKNGSAFKTGLNVNTTTVAPIVSALIYCNGSTDYLELYARFVVGQNNSAGADITYFQAVMVRSA